MSSKSTAPRPPGATSGWQVRPPRRHRGGPGGAVGAGQGRGQDQNRQRGGHSGAASGPLQRPQGPRACAQPAPQPGLHRSRGAASRAPRPEHLPARQQSAGLRPNGRTDVLNATKLVGPDTAGALLVAAGDNPDRLRNERSFAHLCGASPLDASSGKQLRHRLNRGGDRTARAAAPESALSGVLGAPPARRAPHPQVAVASVPGPALGLHHSSSRATARPRSTPRRSVHARASSHSRSWPWAGASPKSL